MSPLPDSTIVVGNATYVAAKRLQKCGAFAVSSRVLKRIIGLDVVKCFSSVSSARNSFPEG